MDSGIADKAAERTEAAQLLIDRARADEVVELVTVSSLELCVLGGPKHPMFNEAIARTWLTLSNRQRKKLMEWMTEGMVAQGKLIAAQPGAKTAKGGRYFPSPELGVALAARCRPTFIVMTERTGSTPRSVCLFALGDQDEPVRGIVVEIPTKLPADVAPDFPQVSKLGPLGWFYRYILVSPPKAAAILAELATGQPSGQADARDSTVFVVSLFKHHDRSAKPARRLTIGPGDPPEQLSRMMLDLIEAGTS